MGSALPPPMADSQPIGPPMGPKDFIRLAALGTAARGPASLEDICTALDDIADRLWSPVRDVIAGTLEDMLEAGVLRSLPGPYPTFSITESGRQSLGALLIRPSARPGCPLGQVGLRLKLAFIDLAPADLRDRSLANTIHAYHGEIAECERRCRQCSAQGNFGRLWLGQEADRLRSELSLLHSMAGTDVGGPMCVKLEQPQPAPPPAAPRIRRKRLKIDEIDAQWHCAIIGTCLSFGELRSLAGKLAIVAQPGPSGYNLHASMVHLASRDHRVAKALSKLLDRRHAAALNRFAKIETDTEITALWVTTLEKGEVGAGLWAVMSHPATTPDTRTRVFQDIHMLSHQVGAAARADLRDIYRLEQEKAQLEAKIERQQTRLHQDLGARDKEISELKQRLADTSRNAPGETKTSESDRDAERLRNSVRELRTALTAETERHRESERKRQETEATLVLLQQRLDQMAEENGALAAEISLHESRLGQSLACGDSLADCDGDCKQLDLCGRCILFVGGRHQQMTHVRRLVEDCNGVFAHHDGGVEDSLGRLHGLFGRADAVLFPVDCVSHSAQDVVKQLCRRWQKPYVPVRRSGLGAYRAALETVATTAPDQEIAP